MSNCIFCKIANNEIVTDFVGTSINCVAFNDLNPQAPVHVLIIPKIHIAKISEISESHTDIVGEMICLAKQIALEKNLEDYRLVINCGEGGGQSVWHVHLHLLGGRTMQWPPG